MINYKKGKIRYLTNGVGSLYIDESKLSSNERPIIYVGGQIEHRGQVLKQLGYLNDKNYNCYTGCWMYDYPIDVYNSRFMGAEKFSESLLIGLREAKINEVVLVGYSHGGLISSYASKSNIISKVICIHSPVLGTPLACPIYFEQQEVLFSKKQQLLLKLLKYIVRMRFGFVIDNYKGINFKKVDLNKIILCGNFINLETETNRLILELYDIVMKISGCKTDGIVPFETSQFSQIGLNFWQTNTNMNHFQANDDSYIKDITTRILNK